MRIFSRGFARLPAIFIALLLIALRAGAQSMTEREARVAYLYNFAKFVDWPTDVLPAHAPINLCTMGDSALGSDLEEAVRGREIAGHKIIVSSPRSDSALRPCHLLYLTGLDPRRIDQILAAVAGAPVFTVSDGDSFAQRGGTANLLFDGVRMRFAINVNSAQRARLAISSRLLALAAIVKDTARARE